MNGLNIKWAVEIKKTSLEHRNIADLLSGLGFSLINGVKFPEFTSPSIDECSNAEQAFDLAKHLRSAFYCGTPQTDPEFTLGAVIDYSVNPPRPNYFIELQSAVYTMSLGNVIVSTLPPSGLSDKELEKWQAEKAEREYQLKLEYQRSRLVPAFWSNRAIKVLELLAIEQPSGEILWKIYELAQGGAGNREKFQNKFYISKDQFDRFKDAVHSPQVSGDLARHAYGHRPNTTNPMSISEAKLFIHYIAYQWLKSVQTNKSDS
ncbi:MAG: hypothetical protein FJ190_07520 [Gammaproteobacteria bacterium]|nr:hypothetical protein [Gammaproteobacteria bacterium]